MNVISYDEQIYLLYFWLRTNVINFEPTKQNIKIELSTEFDVSDEEVIDKIYNLFLE